MYVRLFKLGCNNVGEEESGFAEVCYFSNLYDSLRSGESASASVRLSRMNQDELESEAGFEAGSGFAARARTVSLSLFIGAPTDEGLE